MTTNVLDDDEGFATSNSDSGILFEKACGTENLRIIEVGETTSIGFGDRGVKDAACVHTFYTQIRELIEQTNCRVLILDMHGVWFLPSRTLGALMSLRKMVERVELHNVSDELRESIRIAQLDQLLHVTGPGTLP